MVNIVDLYKWKGWAAIGIASDLLHIEHLYKEGEDLFIKKLYKFEKDFEDKTKNFEPEQKTEYGDFISDEYWKLSEIFPQIFRSALFITCFSRLEYELVYLCKSIYQFNNKLGKPELTRDIILNSKKYLVNNVGISEKIFDNKWSNIIVYGKLRNCFTHNAGIIKKEGDKKNVESFCNRYPKIALITDFKIVLNYGFCELVIKDITEQLLSVYNYMYKNNIKTHVMSVFG